jgi:hypothetical protein
MTMGYYLIEPPTQTLCVDCALALMAAAGLRFTRWLDLVGDEDLACEVNPVDRTVTVKLNAAWQTYSFASLDAAGCCLQPT